MGSVLLQENGYSQDANGLIVQWGHATLFGGGGSTTIKFPMTFPTECFNVVATPIGTPNTTLLCAVQIESVSDSSVEVSGNRTDGSSVTAPSMDIYWHAIGH